MKNPVVALFVLLLGAGAAHSQTASTRAAPARAQQAVRAPAAQATTTAVPTASYGTATRQVIPGNLFSLEDRAIIIVGGRQVAAGDLKRQVATELRGASPVATMRSASRLQAGAGAPVRDLPGGALNVPGGVGHSIRPITARDTVAITGSPRDATLAPGRTTALVNKPFASIAAAKEYCRTHPPEISKIRGVVTPNGRFTIEGQCFGDQSGSVEAIGQFPGGSMRLVFAQWSDVEIAAFVPAVSGAADHTIAVTVVRLDSARSPASPARFVATRAIVPVPERYWTPNADYFQLDVDQGGGNIFSGFKVWGAGAESRSTPFTLAVNPACALDSAGWSTTSGRIDAFNGWENGPPYQANVEVVWTPRCTTQTTNYVFASSSQRICSVGFKLSASASCPLGLSP